MTIIQGVIFLFFGAGVLFVNYISLSTGWLPCGANIFKGFNGRVGVKRIEQSFGYWLLFAFYGIAGIWMLGFGIALLAGHAEPLPIK